MYHDILFEADEGIATLTLNRPDKLNAYTPRMGDELVDAFSRVRKDPSVRVAILTGAGRGFCSGVDLDVLKRDREGDRTRLGEQAFLRKFPLELAAFPKPVLAAINGPAIGVGVTMVLPCDIRIAADTAKLGLPFVKLGLLPGLGSTHWLPRLVGLARAKELVLTGRVIPAAEAAEIGLVNRAVPADSLMKEVRELAASLASCSPEVLAAAKRALHHGAVSSMADAMRNEESESASLRKR